MNNASKGRCVTVTPRGISKEDFRLAILNQIAIGKMPVLSRFGFTTLDSNQE